MNRTSAILAVVFLALGIYLTVSSLALPAGVGRLPGAGFFPGLTGAVMMLLAASLLWQAWREPAESFRLGNTRGLTRAIAVTAAYLLLWGTGWFPLRTALFLALFLRLQGERWHASIGVAAVLTAAVTLAFTYGLRVSLE